MGPRLRRNLKLASSHDDSNGVVPSHSLAEQDDINSSESDKLRRPQVKTAAAVRTRRLAISDRTIAKYISSGNGSREFSPWSRFHPTMASRDMLRPLSETDLDGQCKFN